MGLYARTSLHMYGHVSIAYVFSGLCLRLIQLGAIFDACMGIEKPDQKKKNAGDAFLLALFLGFFSFSCQGYTESQTQCPMSDTHGASNSRHLCSSFRSYNRVGVLAEKVSRIR